MDELTGVRDTPTMAKILSERYMDHEICIYPDASGQNTSSKNASLSDHDILRQHGFKVYVDNANPSIKDRLNAVNRLILDGIGNRTVKINTRQCTELTNALEQQVYDKNGMPDKTSGHDHILDAFGYFLAYRYPISKPVTNFVVSMY